MIMLRMHVELAVGVSTRAVADAVIAAIVPAGAACRVEALPRWNSPDWVELVVAFQAPREDDGAFTDILNRLGSGWEHPCFGNERFAVWHPSAHSSFLSPAVRFATLGLVPAIVNPTNGKASARCPRTPVDDSSPAVRHE